MRIAGTPGPTAKILLSHPEARERAAAIEAIAGAARTRRRRAVRRHRRRRARRPARPPNGRR
jgi:hypothetical protein